MVELYVKRIRDLRIDADLNQTRIAEKIGTNQKVYSRYETAEREIPLHHLIKLAKIYDVSMDYICGLTDERRPFPKS